MRRATQGYPLRPELMESTYLLHAATADASLLEAGRLFQATIRNRTASKCGYASIPDVAQGAPRPPHGQHEAALGSPCKGCTKGRCEAGATRRRAGVEMTRGKLVQ